MNSHVDVASHNNTRYVASTATFDNPPHYTHHNYGYCGEEPMSIVNSSNFDTTSNIQHVNPCLPAISSKYVVSPQDMPMNERIGYDNANYFANCSLNSAPYANAPIDNSTSYVTLNSSQFNENSSRCANGNTHDLASYVAPSFSRINERWVNNHTHDSTSCVASNSNQINENLAQYSHPNFDFQKQNARF